MTEITACLIVQIVTQMYTVTVSHLVALKTFLATHILYIHTIQLLPNYLRSRLLHRWLLSKYLSIYITLYDLFVGLTSQQNGQQL
jgi:hypothetical protein